MARRLPWSATLACVAAALVVISAITPTPASAARRTASWVKVDLAANGGGNRLDIVVRVHTAIPKTRCVGTAKLRGRSSRLSRLRTGAKGGAQWHWFLGDGAPRAKLQIRVSCPDPDHKIHRGATARIVGPGPFERQAYRNVIQPGSLRKEKWVPRDHGHGSGGNDELYPYGQCTWWVATQRRDLPYFPDESGDAKNWIRSAQAKKFPTGTEPRVGAVAVFQPGQYDAGLYGHVAYVVAVSGAQMTVTEANYKDQPPGSRRTLPWDELEFIYKRSHDGGPPPAPRPPPPPAPTGDMTTARASHTATRLADGRVLVTGGRVNGIDVAATAEVYDPQTNTWAAAGSMASPRIFHTATLLDNGKVLVTGGQSALGGGAIATAELYDPASNTWAPAADMRQARLAHAATLLANGKVLVTGGKLTVGGPAGSNADLYDPATNTWKALANMKSARAFHTATRLLNGKVLVNGGDPGGGSATATAELFDPTANTWGPAVPNMPAARVFHTATLLPNRLVLVAGGDLSGGGTATAIAEVYNPNSNTWVRLVRNMLTARMFHTATPLDNGKVLVVGGQSTLGGRPIASTEVYDPATATWTSGSSLGITRVGHTTTLLRGGAVLVTGGDPTGKVLVTGGESSVSASATASTERLTGFG
jgi:surface antigen